MTLMSKTTVNLVVESIQQLIKESVSSEVIQARMYSVQIDTTQDVTSEDQCSVVIRYVTDSIHEKLLAVVECESSSGEDFQKTDVGLLQNGCEELHWELNRNGYKYAGKIQGVLCISVERIPKPSYCVVLHPCSQPGYS